jgi:GNAT superfamily N-acetyltransferase
MRNLLLSDFEFVSSVVDDWWGGRPVRHLLPRLFFEHFTQTSLAIPATTGLLGFLVGFRSQAQPSIGYIHFVGVAPPERGKGLARALYEGFFNAAAMQGCTEVRCITSPVNAGSVGFHRALGFSLVPSPHVENGFPVAKDYSAPGQSRVLFSRQIGPYRGAA